MLDWTTWAARAQGRWQTWRAPRRLCLTDRNATVDDIGPVVQAFAQWCACHPGQVVRVGLSSRWLLYAVLPGPLPDAEARAQAAAHWAHHLDIDALQLQDQWLLRATPVAGATLVCAAPLALVQGLRTQAQAHGVALAWVGPWWAETMQAQVKAQAGATHGVAVEPGLLTHVQWAQAEGGGPTLQAIWLAWLDGGEDAAGTAPSMPAMQGAAVARVDWSAQPWPLAGAPDASDHGLAGLVWQEAA